MLALEPMHLISSDFEADASKLQLWQCPGAHMVVRGHGGMPVSHPGRLRLLSSLLLIQLHFGI